MDLVDGTEVDPPPRADPVASVVRDFLAEAREDGLFAEALEYQAQEKRKAAYVIDRRDIEEGYLIPYGQIIKEGGPFLLS